MKHSQYNYQLLILSLCFVLLIPHLVLAESGEKQPIQLKTEWWSRLKRAADSCYDGREIRVDIQGGISGRTLGDIAESGPFVEAKVTVPLISRREKQQRAQEKGQFLEHGAEILGELLEKTARIGLKQEQAHVLKQAMIQEGLTGIEAYFKILEEIAVLEAKASTSELKLIGFIESCGGEKNDVAKDRSYRPRQNIANGDLPSGTR
jgi:hypothetical protein